ncbi:MAG: ribonucleoside triphosphate reductase, partial [Candidatus Micrarchaeaceae archaeon]
GPYCVGWDLGDLLRKGFGGVPDKIESKPPKHFRTALLQIVNFFYTLQGESAGAQAFSNFDTYLAPFVRYDNLPYKEVKQAMQEFIFNMNVPTRVGFQTPFTNLTMDLQVPSYMKGDHVIIGGEEKAETYGDFQEEVYMINRAFAEIMTEGDASGRVFTFPIPTYNITKDFDWDNIAYKEIWEMTAKYGIPYFANFVNSDMKPEDARSMCCRLRLDTRELKKRGGGLFGANPLTGSIGVITINLPRIGYTSKTENEFFEKLESLMEIAKDALETKRKFIENATELGLYPYSKYYLSSIKAGFGGYWKNHFSTIGLIGMNEAALNFLKKDIGTKEGREFAIRVLDFMRSKLEDFQIETGNIYNLEATPAESTSYDLAKKDKKLYKNIIVANEKNIKNAEPYYTNSSLLPVNYSNDIINVLDLQDDLQVKYTGGTVIHVFLGEYAPSALAVRSLVRKIAENYRLPYYTITPTFSICPVHGYIFGNHEYCPKCDEAAKRAGTSNRTKCEVYSRIVGYLRPVSQWNAGKQEEFKDREMFDKAIAKE